VKPRRGGSSVRIVRANDLDAAEQASIAIHEARDDALLESWTLGVEGTGGVLGDGATARALTPVEIRPHEGRFFDYEEKYSEGGAIELCPPERIPPPVCERIRRLALTAHRVLCCTGYSRTDVLVPGSGDGADEVAEPLYLETNTLPGLTPRSLLPIAAREAGLDFRDLCLEILARAGAGGR
jgi:D-alanine-D-alanine ligase